MLPDGLMSVLNQWADAKRLMVEHEEKSGKNLSHTTSHKLLGDSYVDKCRMLLSRYESSQDNPLQSVEKEIKDLSVMFSQRIDRVSKEFPGYNPIYDTVENELCIMCSCIVRQLLTYKSEEIVHKLSSKAEKIRSALPHSANACNVSGDVSGDMCEAMDSMINQMSSLCHAIRLSLNTSSTSNVVGETKGMVAQVERVVDHDGNNQSSIPVVVSLPTGLLDDSTNSSCHDDLHALRLPTYH